MPLSPSTALFLPLLLLLFGLRLNLCSEQLYESGNYRFLRLTSQSLSCLAARLKSGPADPLFANLQRHIYQDISCQTLCLKFLVGSVAVFGQVDVEALDAICGLCATHKITYLSGLLDELAKENSRSALARFTAQNANEGRGVNRFGALVGKLATRHWSVMAELATEVIATSKESAAQRGICRLMLRSRPIEQQYETINAGGASLKLIDSIYHVGVFDPLLREIFFLARCSRSPNPQIRNYIAERDHYYEQLSDDCASRKDMISYSGGNTGPDIQLWSIIFMFLDAETLILVLPLVCASWNKLYSEVLTRSATVHKLLLQDLDHVDWPCIHKNAPWKYCLPSKTTASKYLGWCITSGALDEIEPTVQLHYELAEYLDSIVAGKMAPPVTKACSSPHGLFMKLFEAIYKFCDSAKPMLERPVFFTDEEYEKAIYHFVYEKRWVLALSRPWLVDNMSKLFSIIKEDELLMTELMVENFGDHASASVALILHAQTNSVPERLTKLVFSQTDLFKRLIGPEFAGPGRYLSLIVEYDMLPELILSKYWMAEAQQLIVSVVLHCKNDSDKIERIVAAVARQMLDCRHSLQEALIWRIESAFHEALSCTDEYSPEDVAFVKEFAARCGLLKRS